MTPDRCATDLWTLEPDGVGDADLRSYLCAEDVDMIARLPTENDRRRAAATRCWTRSVLAGYLHSHPSALDFRRTCGHCGRPHGRPELSAPGSPPLRFSLSHTDQCAVLAVTSIRRVGVDAERQQCVSFLVACLSPEERATCSIGGGEFDDATLVRAWVRKEAVMKVSGLGLAIAPRSLTVMVPDDQSVAVRSDHGSTLSCYLRDVALPCGCTCAVAVDGAVPVVTHRGHCAIDSIPLQPVFPPLEERRP